MMMPPLFFALVLAILDGDTIRARIEVWPGHTVETSIRLAGIDTPEMHGACPDEKKQAEEAKNVVTRLLPEGAIATVRQVSADKYFGRVVAQVSTKDNLNIADQLLKMGLAHRYDGKKKQSWCP